MQTRTRNLDKRPPRPGEDPAIDTPVLARLAGLKAMSVNELKAQWESLFDTPAPNNSRTYLELRIAYRIQELTYGGLARETRRTLDLLADEVEGKARPLRSHLGSAQPGGRHEAAAGVGWCRAYRYGAEGRL